MENPGYTVTVVLSLVMVVAAAVTAIVAVRTADGRIGRNEFAGIRMTSTRASDEAWLAAHQAARRPTLQGCAISGVLALAFAPLGENPVGFVVLLALSVLALSTGVGYGAWVAIRAAREVARAS
ncbi:SdpI/YhfL protein family protein [Paraoerskovia marina]|uniref:SdpI/YhfL protein family protein n=1 Tax=Paraoerskovia marina TaxID=545619 RepID=A0A1H1MWY6_9CELL|nr:SdpI family protein [Paraoerskovia marina]SDR90459.1 SdpI/YhfL protein family protein [Paraoerskovia marina]